MKITIDSKSGIRPSPAALALATKIDPATYADIYVFACMIDAAFENALEAAREEERERIFRMGFLELLREFWKGRKLHASKSM